MTTYTMDEINPKYHEAVKSGLALIGKTENDEITDFELAFCGTVAIQPDFLIEERERNENT